MSDRSPTARELAAAYLAKARARELAGVVVSVDVLEELEAVGAEDRVILGARVGRETSACVVELARQLAAGSLFAPPAAGGAGGGRIP